MFAQVWHQILRVQRSSVSGAEHSDSYDHSTDTIFLRGGFLTGKLLSSTYVAEAGSHFDPKYVQTWFYRERYMSCVAALRELNDLAGKHGLRLAEVAYRWLHHHSALVPEDHGVILGATRAEQLESAILDRQVVSLPHFYTLALKLNGPPQRERATPPRGRGQVRRDVEEGQGQC